MLAVSRHAVAPRAGASLTSSGALVVDVCGRLDSRRSGSGRPRVPRFRRLQGTGRTALLDPGHLPGAQPLLAPVLDLAVGVGPLRWRFQLASLGRVPGILVSGRLLDGAPRDARGAIHGQGEAAAAEGGGGHLRDAPARSEELRRPDWKTSA